MVHYDTEWLRVTEKAAIATYDWIGKGQKNKADAAAVDAMRQEISKMNIRGIIAIGEGERDEAPMLHRGEKLGLKWSNAAFGGVVENNANLGDIKDIAVDPLEGTTLCAENASNALSVIAITDSGGFLHAPDVYMEKIAVGKDLKGCVDINCSVKENLHNIVSRKKCAFEEINVAVLKRERHLPIIEQIYSTGARVQLISDGDVCAAIATAMPDLGIDLYVGIGGAPEGVLAAAALNIMGGDMQGRLVFRNDYEKDRALRAGIKDFNKLYGIDELACGDNMLFVATGITDGYLLKGVKKLSNDQVGRVGFETHSMILSKKSECISYISSRSL